MMDLPEISKAYELRPGATYCVQCDFLLSRDQREMLQKQFSEFPQCQFLILEGGLRLVEPPALME